MSGGELLRCLCCDEPVSQQQGRLFAEVFVCPSCYSVAERLMERAHRELKLVLVMMKDAVRMGLLQKKLRFRTHEELQAVSKEDFLAELGKLVQDAQDRRENWTTSADQETPSSPSTRQPAPTAGG